MSTSASHSPLNISETVRDRGIGSKGPPIGNGLWGIKWSRDWWRYVTLKGQTLDSIITIVYSEAVQSAILATAWLLVLIWI